MAESFGVEGRGSFYDGVGCLRDVVQNHLLQMVCLLAMEPPISSEPDALRDETAKVMKTIRPLKPAELVRGQYAGYRDEPGVAPDSDTETFCALRVHVDSWRWAGVPFSIRAGKALAETVQEASSSCGSRRACCSPITSTPRAERAALPHEARTTRSRSRCRPSCRASKMVSRRVDLDVAYEEALGGEGPRPTSGCWATRSQATRASSRGRTRSRPPGASSTPCSRSMLGSAVRARLVGARRRLPACCPASADWRAPRCSRPRIDS